MSEMDSQIQANKKAIDTIANKMDKDSQHLYDMRQELAVTKNEIEHLTETVNELKLSKKHIITWILSGMGTASSSVMGVGYVWRKVKRKNEKY